MLSRIYHCSSPVIVRVINNSYTSRDNVDSDEDHVSVDLPADCTQLLNEIGMAASHPRKRVAKNPAPSRSSTNTTEESQLDKHENRRLVEYCNKRHIIYGSPKEESKGKASPSKSSPMHPSPLAGSAVRKRKHDEREGTEWTLNASQVKDPKSVDPVFKVARTEESYTVLPDTSASMQTVSSIIKPNLPTNSRNKPTFSGFWSVRHEAGNEVGNSAAQPLDTSAADMSSFTASSPEHAPTTNEALSDNFPPSSAPHVTEAPTTSSSSSIAPPSISTETTPRENAAVASFLSSQKRNLGRLLPTFIELGIKDEDDIASLQNVPREENRRWFEKLSEAGKMTPLEVHILLCALHA